MGAIYDRRMCGPDGRLCFPHPCRVETDAGRVIPLAFRVEFDGPTFAGPAAVRAYLAGADGHPVTDPAGELVVVEFRAVVGVIAEQELVLADRFRLVPRRVYDERPTPGERPLPPGTRVLNHDGGAVPFVTRVEFDADADEGAATVYVRVATPDGAAVPNPPYAGGAVAVRQFTRLVPPEAP
jgi:hypothetical protein